MQILIGYKLKDIKTGRWYRPATVITTRDEHEAAVYSTWFFENTKHGALLTSMIRSKNLVIKPVYAEV